MARGFGRMPWDGGVWELVQIPRILYGFRPILAEILILEFMCDLLSFNVQCDHGPDAQIIIFMINVLQVVFWA